MRTLAAFFAEFPYATGQQNLEGGTQFSREEYYPDEGGVLLLYHQIYGWVESSLICLAFGWGSVLPLAL